MGQRDEGGSGLPLELAQAVRTSREVSRAARACVQPTHISQKQDSNVEQSQHTSVELASTGTPPVYHQYILLYHHKGPRMRAPTPSAQQFAGAPRRIGLLTSCIIHHSQQAANIQTPPAIAEGVV